ncbi:MAG: magnesium transporter [Bacilli bacterium]|jgi:magnesium transporter|nr:magnesium transporter [Bacilli bacterium]
MEEILQEIIELIKSTSDPVILYDLLSHYHKNDIARSFEYLSPEELENVYKAFDEQELSEIFSYLEDVKEYIEGLEVEQAAEIIELMASDDAVEVLEELDEEDRNEILELMDEEVVDDIELLQSYDDDVIASYMTNNYIAVKKDYTIKQAMKTVVEEASRNDNFTIIYVVNEDNTLYGTIELKDLIKARATDNLEDIIKKSYPSILDLTKVQEALIEVKEYEIDSIPVVNSDNVLLGVVTTNDLLELVDDELSDDYAKLAGLSSEEELEESTFLSVKKRIPWLCILLLLGLLISMVMGIFEGAIKAVPAIVFFQSMILGMGGNVGTQSLAVTIRAISDTEITRKEMFRLIFKEIRIAFFNGLLIALISFVVVSLYLIISKTEIDPSYQSQYIPIFKTAAVVSSSLIITMVISGLIGTLIPIILQKCKVDPAVASGPFITSINDIMAIVIYYGITLIVFATLI